MSIKFAINGFGRIGRNIVRAALETDGLELLCINDLTDAQTLAHLLKYDSVHGPFKGEVSARDGKLVINGKEVLVSAERDPEKLPWAKLGVEVVLECTGVFSKKEMASKHLTAGAKKVIISAPSPDADATFVYGVNHQSYNSSEHHIISNGSCTTNCLAPVAKVLLDNFGIERGMITTIHYYTNDKKILDIHNKDMSRARSEAITMINT